MSYSNYRNSKNTMFICRLTQQKSSIIDAGFTMIELLVVFSIIAIISSVGLAGFSSFSKEQTMKTTVDDIRAMLHSARSYTYSQLNSCGNSQQFSGYQVVFCKTNKGSCSTCLGTNDYELDILCNGSPYNSPIQSKKLPANITVTAAVCKSYTFQPITNTVVSSDNQNVTVSYNGSSFSKIISVSQLGIVQTQ